MLRNVKYNESQTGGIDSPMPWDKAFLTKLLKVSSAGLVLVLFSSLLLRFHCISACLHLDTFACFMDQ